MRLHDLFEEQNLLEVNMSPSALRLAASKIDARAGMEFEIIVSGAENDDEEYETEPDYDEDRQPESIQDVVDFFSYGDWVDNDTRSLERKMRAEYEDWCMERSGDDWASNTISHVYQYVVNNIDEEDIFDALDLPRDTEMTKEIARQFAENVLEEEGKIYDDAMEDFMDDWMSENHEEEWLGENYSSMSDFEGRPFFMSWPYVRENNSGNGGDSIETIADEFQSFVGKDTYAADSYHSSATLRPSLARQRYVVEPDGSLDADDQRDRGLEFVSPPMPLSELLDDLKKVVAWCKERGNYTNDSTGLHMNVSIPGYSLDALDYTKLALFLGDEYILKAFGRESNTYCKSALQKIRDRIRPEDREAVLSKMGQELSLSASKIIHSGITDKYTSINTKSDYIEFRSPGGDWLNEDFEKLESTLLRFVVALDIAIKPDAYKQEYAKKLYKLLSPADDGTNIVQLFSNYKSGKIEREQLIQQLKSVQIQRKITKDPTGGQKYWWSVSRPGHFASIEVVASSKEEAIDKAIEPDNYPDWARARSSLQAKPLRPYDTSPVRASVGEPEAVGRQSGPELNGRESNPDGRYVIVPENDRNNVVYRFQAADYDDANLVLAQWRVAHPGRVWMVQRDDNQTLGQPGTNRSGQLSQTDVENRLGWGSQEADANYEIVYRGSNPPRRRFVFIANTPAEAQRKYEQWLAQQGLPDNTEDYGFREIARPGSTLDLQRQRAERNERESTGESSIQWKILVDGEEVHRFWFWNRTNQGEANQVGQEWVLNAIRRGTLNPRPGVDVEIVPVTGRDD